MAWPQSGGTSWPRQASTFEAERAGTGTNLLAQLGLVPSQAMPAGGAHSGSMAQTLLSTTVAPQRSQISQQSVEQVTLGSMEPTAQSQFSFSPPGQRYQTFSPAPDAHGIESEWTNSPPGSMGKRFTFNPNAVPFVFSSPSTTADTFSTLSDSAETQSSGGVAPSPGERRLCSSDEGDRELLGSGDAESVSAAMALDVIGSPMAGPIQAPPTGPLLADNTVAPKLGQVPALPTEILWYKEPPTSAADNNDASLWPPTAVLPPLHSAQEAANASSTPSATPIHASEAMSPTLLQLRGTAHSVALGCLPSPEMGPSRSPRESNMWNDFSLSAAAV